MTETQERLGRLQTNVDAAISAAKADGGASPVLVAVVEELGRKFRKALDTIASGGSERAWCPTSTI